MCVKCERMGDHFGLFETDTHSGNKHVHRLTQYRHWFGNHPAHHTTYDNDVDAQIRPGVDADASKPL
jgi:hypothetical protein